LKVYKKSLVLKAKLKPAIPEIPELTIFTVKALDHTNSQIRFETGDILFVAELILKVLKASLCHTGDAVGIAEIISQSQFENIRLDLTKQSELDFNSINNNLPD
jgi:hypothetical protein